MTTQSLCQSALLLHFVICSLSSYLPLTQAFHVGSPKRDLLSSLYGMSHEQAITEAFDRVGNDMDRGNDEIVELLSSLREATTTMINKPSKTPASAAAAAVQPVVQSSPPAPPVVQPSPPTPPASVAQSRPAAVPALSYLDSLQSSPPAAVPALSYLDSLQQPSVPAPALATKELLNIEPEMFPISEPQELQRVAESLPVPIEVENGRLTKKYVQGLKAYHRYVGLSTGGSRLFSDMVVPITFDSGEHSKQPASNRLVN